MDNTTIKIKPADAYLIDAIKRIASLVEREDKEHLALTLKGDHHHVNAARESKALVGVHALLSLLDYELGRIASAAERQCIATEEIAESLDFLAARFDADDVCEQPTKHELKIIFQALKSEYIAHDSLLSQKEQEDALCAALCRFVRLSAMPDGDKRGELPTERELMIMYRALEADYMAQGNSPSIKEMDTALLRFKKLVKKLAGL